MDEKDSEMSGPHEEFRICFCGKSPSGSVEWYLIDVSVEEACLSEKTESSTRKLTPFWESQHLSSCAALGGHIYSLGDRRRSPGGGDTLLSDVWLLDFKSLEDFKLVPGRKPELQKSPTVLSQDEAQAQSQKSVLIRSHDEAQAQKLSSEDTCGADFLDSRERNFFAAEFLASRFIEIEIERARARAELARAERARAEQAWQWKPGLPLDFKSLEDFKLVPGRKPELQKSPSVLSHDEAQAQKLSSEDLCGADFLDSREQKLSAAEQARQWKPGLPMNFARYNPHTMVVDHKLYVLGGFLPNQNQADGWIEVFDPEEKKWESLPSPPDQIHSSIMISGLLKSKKEIIIARQRRDCRPLLFYSYNITTRCWNELSLHSDSKASVHPNVERAIILPPNSGRAVTVGNTLYWISTEEDNDECTIRAYDLDSNMWFEGHLKTDTIFGSREEYFSSIYSRGPGFLHLVDQKFCLLLQSSVTEDPQPSIEYLYCVILNISRKCESTIVSVQKYSMDHYIDFLDCMLLPRD